MLKGLNMRQVVDSFFQCICNLQNHEQPIFHRELRESGSEKKGGKEDGLSVAPSPPDNTRHIPPSQLVPRCHPSTP